MATIVPINDQFLAVINDAGEITDLIVEGQTMSLVRGVTDQLTGGVKKIWTGTQAEYDAIAVKADDTLYIIVAG